MKTCTAYTNHDHWCDCGSPDCWEEQLRLRVNFDKNQDREVCILFIHRLLASKRSALLRQIEKYLAQYDYDAEPIRDLELILSRTPPL